MEFLAKCLFFFALFAATYGRYIRQDRNVSEGATDCSCDWKYFKHYETLGCVVETVDSCGCPRKFDCPSAANRTRLAKACVHQKKEYKVGSKIVTSNPCQVCRCHDGVPPRISCITRECPPMTAVGRDCHPVYKENRCCPHEFECLGDEFPDDAETIKTCEYNGQLYPFGSRIYPEDDPCQVCVCDENWTSGADNSTSCYEQDCLIERNRPKLEAGCIPVYHERRCCPIEFYCPSSHNMSYSELANNESSEDQHNTTYDNHCYFADQFYELGEELGIGNPCIKCTCAVPPDFTCVHQTCPPSPSEDFCNRIYSPGECCPSYECMAADAPEPRDGCPTPVCADSSCRIEVPEGHECLTCICGDSVLELEHNNLEQVQQISQNMEQMEEPVQLVFVNGDDYSEEGLQMMPLRIQDSEEMILPEMEPFAQEQFRELEENVKDDFNSTVEETPEEEGAIEHPETMLNKTDKVVQKRSEVSQEAFPVGQEEDAFNEDIEREGVDFEDDHFDDELRKIFFDKNGTIINEIFTIDHRVEVPPGCPTPLCEGPWCKIGIPEGHRCPTCICKRRTGNEP